MQPFLSTPPPRIAKPPRVRVSGLIYAYLLRVGGARDAQEIQIGTGLRRTQVNANLQNLIRRGLVTRVLPVADGRRQLGQRYVGVPS